MDIPERWEEIWVERELTLRYRRPAGENLHTLPLLSPASCCQHIITRLDSDIPLFYEYHSSIPVLQILYWVTAHPRLDTHRVCTYV